MLGPDSAVEACTDCVYATNDMTSTSATIVMNTVAAVAVLILDVMGYNAHDTYI